MQRGDGGMAIVSATKMGTAIFNGLTVLVLVLACVSGRDVQVLAEDTQWALCHASESAVSVPMEDICRGTTGPFRLGCCPKDRSGSVIEALCITMDEYHGALEVKSIADDIDESVIVFNEKGLLTSRANGCSKKGMACWPIVTSDLVPGGTCNGEYGAFVRRVFRLVSLSTEEDELSSATIRRLQEGEEEPDAPSPDPTEPPTPEEADSPTEAPSISPSTSPSATPTSSKPSTSPSTSPSATPTSSKPSTSPSTSPSESPTTSAPSNVPSTSPSKNPTTSAPSHAPSTAPSKNPTTSRPSGSPSASPSKAPTTSRPSKSPSAAPSNAPSTSKPTNSPSTSPSTAPSLSPSVSPSMAPTTSKPTHSPSTSPSTSPSVSPSTSPTTSRPSTSPSAAPTTSKPSIAPTTSKPTVSPSLSPTTSRPSVSPSASPTTSKPSVSPTTSKPSWSPTTSPTTSKPTTSPTTSKPTHSPSVSPTTSKPSTSPSTSPTTSRPTASPTTSKPTHSPSASPTTSKPSTSPTTSRPTVSPSRAPTTSKPTMSPTTSKPSKAPTTSPTTSKPSAAPTTSKPTTSPSTSPSKAPTTSKPTHSPTVSPTTSPSHSPSVSPSRAPTFTVIQVRSELPVTAPVITGVDSTFSFQFENVYPLKFRIDACEGYESWLTSPYGDGLYLEETNPANVANVIATVPPSLLSSAQPSMTTPEHIGACFYLIAIMHDQVVYNRTIEADLEVRTRCQAGSFSSTGINYPVPCTLCDLGRYSDTGSTTCEHCPEDRPRTDAIGTSDIAGCQKCPLGKYCPVGSPPIDCPASGFYEDVGDDMHDRTAGDCVKTRPCEDGYWCGPGAAADSSYVQELILGSVETTSVIRQRKNAQMVITNLNDEETIVVLRSNSTDEWFYMDPVEVNKSSEFEATVAIESALLDEDVEKVNANVPLAWYRASDPSMVFIYRNLPVSVTIVGIVVTPVTFETSISSQTDQLIPPIPTEINVYNTLCGNMVLVKVPSVDCSGEPLPDWFNLTGPNPHEPRAIQPQNGLPLVISFNLVNSAGLQASRSRDDQINRAAPFIPLCFNLELELDGLGIEVIEQVNISFRLLKPCPPGSFSLAGTDEQGCSLCPQGYYQSQPGSTFCDKCPDNLPRTLHEGADSESDCLTDRGGFLSLNNTREECPAGAVCDEIGVTIETLEILPGRWRTSPHSTSLLECPRSHYCRGGRMVSPSNATNGGEIQDRRLQSSSPADNICLTNHTGAFCYNCVPGTVKRTGMRVCQECQDTDYESDRVRISAIFGAIGVLLFSVFALTYAYTYRSYLLSLGRAKKREFEDRARAIYHALDFSTPVQIVISFLQVVSGMSVTFQDVLPEFFTTLQDIFSFLAVDLINLLDFGCTLSAQNHLTSLILTTLLPLGVSILLFCMHLVIEKRFAKRDRALRQMLRTTTFTSFLIINFLVYPACSNTILATLACRELDDGTSVLTKDPSVSCQTDTYMKYRGYAIFMLFVYPLGIPALYGTLLYKWRQPLNPYAGDNKRFGRVANAMREKNKSIQFLKFLWGPYKPDYFWYEMLELSRKLAQTSIVVFIPPGSSAQIIFQLLTTVVFVVVINAFRPYSERMNNYLALLSQWSLFGIALATLLIRFNKLPSASSLGVSVIDQLGTEYNQDALDGFMVFLLICVPIAGILLIVFKSLQAYRIVLFCINWDRLENRFKKKAEPVLQLRSRISVRVKSGRLPSPSPRPDGSGGGEVELSSGEATENPLFRTNEGDHRNAVHPVFKMRGDDDDDEEKVDDLIPEPTYMKPPSFVRMAARPSNLIASLFSKRPSNLAEATTQTVQTQAPAKSRVHRASFEHLLGREPRNLEETKDMITRLKAYFELVKEDLENELQQERTKKKLLLADCDELDDEKLALETELAITRDDDDDQVRTSEEAVRRTLVEGRPVSNSGRRLGITIDVISEHGSEPSGSDRQLSTRTGLLSESPMSPAFIAEVKPSSALELGPGATSESAIQSKRVTFSAGRQGSSQRSPFQTSFKETSTGRGSEDELEEEDYEEERHRRIMGRRTLLARLRQAAAGETAESTALAPSSSEEAEGGSADPGKNRQSFRSIRVLARKKLEAQQRQQEARQSQDGASNSDAESANSSGRPLRGLPSFRNVLQPSPPPDEDDDSRETPGSAGVVPTTVPRRPPTLITKESSNPALSSSGRSLGSAAGAFASSGRGLSVRLSAARGSEERSASPSSVAGSPKGVPILMHSGSGLRPQSTVRVGTKVTFASATEASRSSPQPSPSGAKSSILRTGRSTRAGSSGRFAIERASQDSQPGRQDSTGGASQQDGDAPPGVTRARSVRSLLGRLVTKSSDSAAKDVEEEVITSSEGNRRSIRVKTNKRDGTFEASGLNDDNIDESEYT